MANCWFSSYLFLRNQRIIIGNTLLEPKDLNFGVQQGSCAGHVLYTTYASSLSQVVSNHIPNVLGYADDHALYSSFKVTETENIVNAVSPMDLCLTEVKNWMNSSRLKQNDAKSCMLIKID